MAASMTDLVVSDYKEDGTIASVRSLIRQVANRPQGPYQVFVLLNIEYLTDQAANALLKTFEDVAPDTLFLMTCQTPHTLLPTIRSRVVIDSYDQQQEGIDDVIPREVGDFTRGIYFPLLSRILGNKIDRSQCIDIAHALQSAVKDGSICSNTSIHRISQSLEMLSTSNVTAKYQIDTVLFDLLR